MGGEEEGGDPRPPEAPLAMARLLPGPAIGTTATAAIPQRLSGTLGDPAPGEEGGTPGGWVSDSSQNGGNKEIQVGGKQEIEHDTNRTTNPPSKTADRPDASETHTRQRYYKKWPILWQGSS